MAELVALDLGGDGFVEALRRVWDEGDAVLPLDPRAPLAHSRRILDALAPSAVISSDGRRTGRPGGVPVEPGDAVVIATSGTTGDPKGAVHTHAGVAAAARLTAAATCSGAPAVRWLACLPLAHVGGFSVVTRALLTDTGLEVHDRADTARIDDAAGRGATHVSLVPTLLGRIDPVPWRAILLGGSAVPVRRPDNTIATYGMTETFGGIVYDGRPLEGVEVRIAVDGDRTGERRTGEERVGRDSAGEPAGSDTAIGPIELRSPTTLRAYRHGPDGSADPAGTDPRGSDGWLSTGDLGVVRADASLHVLGRSDDLIISGGSKVWPAPVEEVLRTQPGIDDVAVVGVSDPEWGERVVAIVVPSDPRFPPRLEDLRSAVRSELPVAAAPKEMRLVDVLPRTPLGKIMRSALVQGTRKADPHDS